jgi:hypothetical protein
MQSQALDKTNRTRALRFVLAALGFVLATAGVLKISASALSTGLTDEPALFLAVVSTLEIGFGLWLIGGFEPDRTRPWAVAVFVGLWAASAWQALSGRCTCGCFGDVQVSPWLVLLFDLAAVTLLLRLEPSGKDAPLFFQSSPPLALALATVTLLAFGVGGWRPPKLNLAGTATLGGRALGDAELELLGDSFAARVRTDDQGAYRVPAVPPGVYSVTLFDRSTRLKPADFSQSRRAVTKALARMTRRQKQALARAREGTRLAGPGGDAVTVWLDVSDCSPSEVKLEYK